MLLCTIQLINGMTDAFGRYKTKTKKKNFAQTTFPLFAREPNTIPTNCTVNRKNEWKIKIEKRGNVCDHSNHKRRWKYHHFWTLYRKHKFFCWNPLKCLYFAWIRVIKPSNTFSCFLVESHLNFGIIANNDSETPQLIQTKPICTGNQHYRLHLKFLESKLFNHNRFSIVYHITSINFVFFWLATIETIKIWNDHQ